MRIRMPLALLCLNSLCLLGQEDGKFSFESSYDLIYKLSLEEAKTIAHSGSASVGQLNLFNRIPYDTLYPGVDLKYNDHNGFYLRVKAAKQRLEASLELVQSLEIKKIPDGKYLRFIVLENGTQEVQPTEVSLDGKLIRYDQTINAYRIKPGRGSGTVVVRHLDQEAIFPIYRSYKRLFDNFGNKVLYSFPVKVVYGPSRDIYQSIAYGEAIGVVRKAGSLFFLDLRNDRAYGYLLLNKPKYKPGDTLRYKLKLAKENGRTYSKKVTVSLGGTYKPRFKQTIRLKKGQTQGEIILHDSMNLRLDGYQWLSVMRHNDQLISTSFDYEDYILKSETHQLQLVKERHSIADENRIILSGRDENDNRLKNSRYELEVHVVAIEKNRLVKSLYVPQALFTKQGRLAPDKDTEIILADSLFPKVNMEYEVKVAFINAANDRVEKTQKASYSYNQPEIGLEIKNDSAIFSFPENYEGDRQLNIIAVSALGDIKIRPAPETPLKVKLNPSLFSYKVFDKDSMLLKFFDMRSFDSGVSHKHNRTADSLNISIRNDHHLPMWYTLYRENRKIKEGYTEASQPFKLRAKNKDSYLMTYRYLWAGNISQQQFEMDLYNRALNIAVEQQSLIIPGISDSIRVRVTDYKGRPVSNVDVASASITGKFKEDNIPSVPYFGLSGRLTVKHQNFNLNYRRNQAPSLNYERWKKPFGLDSVLYYQITRPESVDVFYLDTEDEQTQFAILSMKNGFANSTSYIKLDGELVYTYLQHQTVPFSFKAAEGFHSVEIRTFSELLKIDSVHFKKGKKTTISIAEGVQHKHLTRRDSIAGKKWPLTTAELSLLADHTFQVQLSQPQVFSVVQKGRKHNFTRRYQRNAQLGPFSHDSLTVITEDETYNVLFEPGYIYEFSADHVFKKAHQPGYFRFDRIDANKLFELLPSQNVDNTKATTALTTFSGLNLSGLKLSPEKGMISINPPVETLKTLTNVFLLPEASDSSFIELDARLTMVLDSGQYKAILLYSDSTFISEKVYLKANGTTLLSPDSNEVQSFEHLPSVLLRPKEVERRAVNPRVINVPAPRPNLTGFITGKITGADDGLPLPQVTVLIKGTTIGVPSDGDGFYRLPTPDNQATIVFRYLGYVTQEIITNFQSIINVQLTPDIQSLGEVVVTGYGVSSRSAKGFLGATEMSQVVQGKIAGIEITGASGQSGTYITLRGTSSIASGSPLYIVDGVIVANMDNISQESISNISVLKTASATAIYGARGANGVVLIKTNGPGQMVGNNNSLLNIDQEASGSSIRNNFRDYAYWEPSVTTDKNGEAILIVQYPDDITSWKNHFLAMSNSGLTGQLKTTTKAFKPLSSRLSIPRFLIVGDSSRIYGEISNYTGDSTSVTRSFKIADKDFKLGTQPMLTGHIDNLEILATKADSLEITYLFEAQSGNDGERRILPILRKGLEQNKGTLYNLDKDTAFNISPLAEYGNPNITIVSNLRGLLLEDIKLLQQYAYWCNEQKASKLMALLAEKQLLSKSGLPFKKNGEIRSVLRRIRKARNNDGGWGWWQNMGSAPWVTNHVVKALLQAQLEGYNTKTDLEESFQILVDKLALLQGPQLIETMHVLLDIDPKTDLANYLEVAQVQRDLTTTDKIRLIHLEYRIDSSFAEDSLSQYRKESILGGVHYQEDQKAFRSNDVFASLAAYSLLKEVGKHDDELAKIREYLMLNRNSGRFNNTYEAAGIISTIGDDLDTTRLAPEVRINDELITSFPYQASMQDLSPINVSLNSSSHTYLTVSQNHWNSTPVAADSLAQIVTHFQDADGERMEVLKKGKQATIKVQIEVSEHQRFVMLEVPIPGGCNYYDKPQPFVRSQYREYFKDRVNFYFENLEPGKHEFEIPLISQFSGKFTLNPAKMSLMYSPLLGSNNQLKEIIIH